MKGTDFMKKILFINSCPRPRGISRTLRLSDYFLKCYTDKHPEYELTEIRLFDEDLRSLTAADIERRDALLQAGKTDDPFFRFAHQFVSADRILIGAPYWDLSFPSILKVYVEHLCAGGITFQYTETGSEGLSHFEKAIYITTSGGFIEGNDYGTEYIKGVLNFLGNGTFTACYAEGLDICGNDSEKILQKKEKELSIIAEKW